MIAKNKIFLLVLIVVMVVSLLIGCQAEKKKSVEELAKEVIQNNLKYIEEGNVDKYMSTMHPDSPVYERTEKVMEKVVETYDLDYKVKEAKVINKTKDEVQVEVVQITKKINGPQFRDNKTKAVHILRKNDKGQWKIYNTKINNIEYLN